MNNEQNSKQVNQEAPIYANINPNDANIHVPHLFPENFLESTPDQDLCHMEDSDQFNRNFFADHPNIHKINCLIPIDKYISPNYIKITGPNITTEYINSTPYSHLTNPQNIESKFYFASRDIQTMHFKSIVPWRSGILHDITYEELIAFLKDINIITPTKIAYQEYITSYENRRRIWGIFAIILLVMSVGLYISIPFVIWRAKIGLSVAATVMLLVFALITCVGRYSMGRKTTYDLVNRIYIFHDTSIEESIVTKWNEEFFIRRGVFVTYPRNFAYLQFNVDKDWKLELEDHHL